MAYLYTTYGYILEPDLKKNNIPMMKPYNHGQPTSILIKQLEAGQKFAAIGRQIITNNMMISKEVMLLIQIAEFILDIKEWQHYTAPKKTWEHFKVYFHKAHHELQETTRTGKVVTTSQSMIYLVLEGPKQIIFGKPTYHTTRMVEICQQYQRRPNQTSI